MHLRDEHNNGKNTDIKDSGRNKPGNLTDEELVKICMEMSLSAAAYFEQAIFEIGRAHV